jgi:Rps23 Pro-64 3,4-dihydroxylase Tpa1-like proline 4-hydroxylase
MEADIDFLDRLAEAKRDAYAAASPFPHIAIDDFIRPEVLEAVLQEIEARATMEMADVGTPMDDRFQRKWACNSTRKMGPKTRALIQFMNGQEIIGFLEKLTGIDGLVADPQLAGGGLHELRDTGFLNVHADFNFHDVLKLDRRINLLLYLNKDWAEEYGGELQLWDEKMEACAARFLPIFNRCVIFNTTDRSFHGNPNPVRLPEGRDARRSIAFYYYTNGRPHGEASTPHGTIFKHEPGHASAADHARHFGRRWLPPVVADALARYFRP